MNLRQQELLEFLIRWSHTPVSREFIQANLADLYPSDGSTSHYNDVAYAQITKDIQFINDDLSCDYFVISKPSGIRIASSTDYQDELLRERITILKRLARVHTKMRKANKHNNQRFNFLDGEIELIKSMVSK